MNIEFTSVKEMLTAIKSNLVAEKAKFNELQKEIDNDLMDCELALKALEKQEPEPIKTTDRVPKVGDKLISIKDKYFAKDEEVEVIHVDDDYFDVISENATIGRDIHISSLHKIFRFKDETPTAEDLSNLHSFQHVNRKEDKLFTHMSKDYDITLVGSELDEIRNVVKNENPEPTLDRTQNEHDNGGFVTKKPYRIKTREEMIRDGAKEWFDGYVYQDCATPWNPQMSYMHGRELDTNENQTIKAEPNHPVEEWIIDTWMITENN